MDPRENPYTPNAGARPPAFVGRRDELVAFDILLDRLREGYAEQSLIVTGLRGVGKTVLLQEFRERALERDWIVVDIEVAKHDDDQFRAVLARELRRALFTLAPKASWSDRARRAAAVLRSFTLGIDPDGRLTAGFEVEPAEGHGDSGALDADLSDVLTAIGEAAKDHSTGVVLLFDEIQFLTRAQLEAVIVGLHRTVQRRLPITLTAAGLPQLAELAGEAKPYSERLFRFPVIDKLVPADARLALASPAGTRGVGFAPEALEIAIEFTEGYPYFRAAVPGAVHQAAQARRPGRGQNFEFFNANPDGAPGSLSPPLSARLFRSRLELLTALDAAGTHTEHRASIAELLRVEVAAMNPQNIVVAPHRELVDRFTDAKAWADLDVGATTELARTVAGLPTALPAEPEATKRFDLLVLHLQLAHLTKAPGFGALAAKVRGIAAHLEDYLGVPAVAAQALFITDVQRDEWWEDLQLAWLEDLRLRLRQLIPFIQKAKQVALYTDFTDTLGEATEIDLSGIVDSFEKFRRKARHFLREHLGQAAVGRLHANLPISVEDVERAEAEAGGFGLFVRGLVGLDRAAAKAALGEFLDGARFTADQIEFVDMVVEHLVEHGLIEVARFYSSPFVDPHSGGPEGLFDDGDIDRLVEVVNQVRRNAQAA